MADSSTNNGGSELKGTRIGVVESDARDKSRKVVLRFVAKHPKYGKYVARRTVLQVHDEHNESHNGDVVEVAQCRPISKTKSWKLVRIVEQRSKALAEIAGAGR
ncbi:MAG: 30S ribosomal protein S17 [Planctomycetota bacterium]